MNRHLGTTVDVNGHVVRRWMGSDGTSVSTGFRLANISKNTAEATKNARKMIIAVASGVAKSPDPHPEYVRGYEAVIEDMCSRGAEINAKKGEMGGNAAERFFLEGLSHAMGKLNDRQWGGAVVYDTNSEKSRDGQVMAMKMIVQDFASSLETSWKNKFLQKTSVMSLSEEERMAVASDPSLDPIRKEALTLDSSMRVLGALGRNANLTDAEALRLIERPSTLAARAVSQNTAVSSRVRRKAQQRFHDMMRSVMPI